MFKELKIQTKIIMAFILPLTLFMVSSAFSVISVQRSLKESQKVCSESARHFKAIKEAADDPEQVEKHAQAGGYTLDEFQAVSSAMSKQLMVQTLIITQLAILLIMIVAFFMARHVQKWAEAEKNKAGGGEELEKTVLADMIKAALLSYACKSGQSESQVLEDIVSRIQNKE